MDKAHRNAQTSHAINRCHERYGIEMTERDLRVMVRKIESGESLYAGNYKDCDRSLHLVQYFDIDYLVVYDPVTRCIATFLIFDDKVNDVEFLERLRKQQVTRGFRMTEEQERIYKMWLSGFGTFVECGSYSIVAYEKWEIKTMSGVYNMMLNRVNHTVMSITQEE